MTPKYACNLYLVVNLATDIWLSWISTMICHTNERLSLVLHGNRSAYITKLGWWSGMDHPPCLKMDRLSHTEVHGSKTFTLTH